MTNYYHILGLKNFATIAEVKGAFRKLAKQYHPDINPNGQDHFKSVLKAYEVLSDNYLKTQHDNKLRYSLNYNYKRDSFTPREDRSNELSEKELKRRQYYQENYKQQFEEAKAEVQKRKQGNEFRNILVAAPLAVFLIMILLNVWSTKPQIKVEVYEEPLPLPKEASVERKRVITGDTPYMEYYGGAKTDTIANQKLTIKNLTGSDFLLFLFSKKKFIRTCYIEHSYEVTLESLPIEISIVKVMTGSNFQYTHELTQVGLFGGFTKDLKFYVTNKKVKLNGANSITLSNLEKEGFKETTEKLFFESGV